MKRWYSFYNERLTKRQRPIDENCHQAGDEIRQQPADELYPNRQQIKLRFMESDNRHIILFLIILFCSFGYACGNCTSPRKQTMVVDIYNYFRQDNIENSLDTVSFVSKDTCLQLTQGENGDYHCDYLKDKILMYYPADYNIVFMLCDPPTANNELYVYIDSIRYLVQPQKTYAVYPIDVFFSTYLYLNLQEGDSLLYGKKTITLHEEHAYEILEVVDDYIKVREVQYNETHIPRFNSLLTAPIYLYHWRDGFVYYTKRFVIDE